MLFGKNNYGMRPFSQTQSIPSPDRGKRPYQAIHPGRKGPRRCQDPTSGVPLVRKMPLTNQGLPFSATDQLPSRYHSRIRVVPSVPQNHCRPIDSPTLPLRLTGTNRLAQPNKALMNSVVYLRKEIGSRRKRTAKKRNPQLSGFRSCHCRRFPPPLSLLAQESFDRPGLIEFVLI
jgi:hypothetical protein